MQKRFIAVLLFLAAAVLADVFFIGDRWPAGPYVIIALIAAYLLDFRRMIYSSVGILAAEILVHVFEPIPLNSASSSIVSTAVFLVLGVTFARKTEKSVELQRRADELERQEAIAAQEKKLLEQSEADRARLQEVHAKLQTAHEELQAASEELAKQNRALIQVNERLIEAETNVDLHAKRLEAIQYVTDAALAELRLQDLLQELLSRVRNVLSSDTATILILDRDGQHLTVADSAGFDEEAPQKVQIPIGSGVAGRIASTRQAMVFDDLREVDVCNPLLKRTVRSLLGSPLIAQNKLIGVLHVGTNEPRRFTEDDMSLLQLVADRVALAIESAQLFQEMQYERERWRTTVESIPELVCVSDAEGHTVYINPIEAQLFGHRVDNNLPLAEHPAFYNVTLPDGNLAAVEDLPLQQAALTGEVVHDLEFRLRTVDGEERITLWDASPIRDSDGKISGAVAVGRDITQGRQAEDDLRQTKDYLENLFNYANAPIIVWDPEFRITRFNHAFEYLTGYLADEVIGQKLTLLFPDDSRDQSLAMIQRTLAGEYWESVEIPIRRKDGGVRIALWNSANIHAGDERTVVATIAQGQDITERKQVELERERLLAEVSAHRQRAEEAVKARDEFLSVASHELKTPVTSMLGFSQLALRWLNKEGSLDLDKGKGPLETIERQAQKLAFLISKLLDISRIEAGKLTLELQETDVPELVERVAESARMNGSNIVVSNDCLPSLTAFVDPLRLEQVLTNLIENAVKYGGDGDIELSLTSSDHRIELVVRDHGPGIPPEHRDGVFSRFYQVERDKRGGGMGLGLYISSEIVALHGGTIEAEFPEDGGTRFVVRLPVRVDKVASIE